MKKTLILTLTLFLLLFSKIEVYAEFSTTSSSQARKEIKTRTELQNKLDARKALLEQKRKEIRERIEQRKASAESRLTEARIKIIQDYWNRLSQRLSASIQRLEKIISRIETRLAKIKETNQNINVTTIQSDLEKNKQMLANTKVKLDTADNIVIETLNSENPKDAFLVVRDLIKEIKKDLVEIHKNLVHLIGRIKGLRVGTSKQSPTPTSPSE